MKPAQAHAASAAIAAGFDRLRPSQRRGGSDLAGTAKTIAEAARSVLVDLGFDPRFVFAFEALAIASGIRGKLLMDYPNDAAFQEATFQRLAHQARELAALGALGDSDLPAGGGAPTGARTRSTPRATDQAEASGEDPTPLPAAQGQLSALDRLGPQDRRRR